jgi:hypothetical protein
MITAIDQTYVVGFSFVPGIKAGEEYHWNALLNAAVENNLQTLSSSRSFLAYNRDGSAKVLVAVSLEYEKERLCLPLM